MIGIGLGATPGMHGGGQATVDLIQYGEPTTFHGSGPASTVISSTHVTPPGDNRLLIVTGVIATGSSFDGVLTYGGEALTLIAGGGSGECPNPAVYTLADPPVGSATLAYVNDGGYTYGVSFAAISASGVYQSDDLALLASVQGAGIRTAWGSGSPFGETATHMPDAFTIGIARDLLSVGIGDLIVLVGAVNASSGVPAAAMTPDAPFEEIATDAFGAVAMSVFLSVASSPASEYGYTLDPGVATAFLVAVFPPAGT